MTTPPTDPQAPRKQLTSALVWTVVAAAVAVVVFINAADPENEKRTFYAIAGVIAVIATIMNGYNAWLAYKQSKAPPAA
jgi:bacteriorhodopsin